MVTQMVVHSFELFNLRHFCQKHQASEGTSGLKRDRNISRASNGCPKAIITTAVSWCSSKQVINDLGLWVTEAAGFTYSKRRFRK